MKAMENRVAGFTLIELLIVVAIVAILGAIAVPNFLISQTRAKVARVKADMIAEVRAIEAYAMDYKNYPSHPKCAGNGSSGTIINWWGVSGNLPKPGDVLTQILTTPVAYLPAMPLDPFMEATQTKPYPYIFQNWCYLYNDTKWTTNSWRFTERFWDLDSMGPDRHWSGMSATLTYDPTNGVISEGDIQYYGPGKGFAGLSSWPIVAQW